MKCLQFKTKFPKDSFTAHPKNIKHKCALVRGSHGALWQNNHWLVLYPLLTSHKLKHASLPPDFPLYSLPNCPHPSLFFHSIVPSFSVWLVSPITNKPCISPPPHSFIPISLSLSLFPFFARCWWKAGIEPAVAFQNLRPRLQCVWLFNTAGSH